MIEEKAASPDPFKQDPFLIRNPWFSIIMIIILYFLFLFVPQTVYISFSVILSSEPKLYITQITVFLSLALLLLVIVPFLFRIPNNNQNYKEYSRDIQIQGTNFKAIGLGLLNMVPIVGWFVTGWMIGIGAATTAYQGIRTLRAYDTTPKKRTYSRNKAKRSSGITKRPYSVFNMEE